MKDLSTTLRQTNVLSSVRHLSQLEYRIPSLILQTDQGEGDCMKRKEWCLSSRFSALGRKRPVISV
ncbi:hypothetical protein CEXT_466731, partial [Caerostris extrusa]